jgi:hypothetical protein
METLSTVWFDGSVPADDAIVVDAEFYQQQDWENERALRGAAVVVCRVQTEHLESGWRWNETMVYKLSGFDKDGRFIQWVSTLMEGVA